MKTFKTKAVAGLALFAGLTAAMTGPRPAQAQNQGALGTQQQAGPFQVTLIGAPQTGRTRFEVRVTRDNQPVPDARVSLNLSMPYHKHGATIERLGAMDMVYGQYAGTVRTRMSGIYDARVIVNAGGDKSTALYRFNTDNRPFVAHLGMWHPAGGFEVQLTTDPTSTTARVGENRFRVQVTREGYPVTDAEVGVGFTMPQMARMGSVETYARLTPENGAYVGTARLAHTGTWRAFVTVKSAGKTGRAAYDFPAR